MSTPSIFKVPSNVVDTMMLPRMPAASLARLAKTCKTLRPAALEQSTLHYKLLIEAKCQIKHLMRAAMDIANVLMYQRMVQDEEWEMQHLPLPGVDGERIIGEISIVNRSTGLRVPAAWGSMRHPLMNDAPNTPSHCVINFGKDRNFLDKSMNIEDTSNIRVIFWIRDELRDAGDERHEETYNIIVYCSVREYDDAEAYREIFARAWHQYAHEGWYSEQWLKENIIEPIFNTHIPI